ncbi:asparagine synthase (glutamine-hydrolyzing) [Synechococcus sp. MIT S9220]|uniref:asparagine synthase (glutamine-hydrolyzing) n=1 Tax=unclassified Synechococcus TaxID=2626047 RepID=UPI00164B43B6|nr:asparagine synthase (glutamine-hydrolyzing) [Synechococcus sp. MIT S9220]NOL48048.1 asparagine synthase (glutamine-hydrolyzing) [Synechococcus sp. MIT S9220]QNJ21514.1 asparagine synthase (glutamine-hydrolyzing) [Synechococcus sp. MIT S9220]
MCGLFGSLGFEAINTEAVFEALQERGPDDRGRWREDSEPEGLELLHTRLAIQDCSRLGHQPMVASDNSLVLVFNGEIYNQKELRSQLEKQGYLFRSECDTEVLMNGFRHWRQGVWSRINGIFAAACWETASRRLTLARDRFGIKPLLWKRDDEGRCTFSSELSALKASGCIEADRINAHALDSYRLWGAITGPLSIIEGTESLPAGHTAVRHQDGTWEIDTFTVQTPISASPESWTLSSATSAIGNALEQAIEQQSIGDHPVGMYLSGGLDSSLLAATLKRHQSKPINSVSVGFNGLEGASDESERAEHTAKHLGLKHKTLRIGITELDKHFDAFIAAIDQPSIDGFNTFLVTTAAREQGMRVAFSGLGADELFGGYPHMLKGSLKKANQARHIRLHGLTKHQRNLMDCERIEKAGLAKIKDYANQQDCSRLELAGYLQETLLRDADATTMAQGLELRVPFLDQGIVDLALQIPQHIHQMEGNKTLLRRLAAPLVPAAVLTTPKQGFNLALAPWLELNPRFRPQRINSLLEKNLERHNLRIPRRTIAKSWMLLKISGKIAPYWRWVVLAEWLQMAKP